VLLSASAWYLLHGPASGGVPAPALISDGSAAASEYCTPLVEIVRCLYAVSVSFPLAVKHDRFYRTVSTTVVLLLHCTPIYLLILVDSLNRRVLRRAKSETEELCRELWAYCCIGVATTDGR
jgi:hypothetical protein